ncbi:hypothetical protein HDE_08521 [Halotydeus destructor]|nr:hypothetical protein HDE_08521 [Halotydeus destructor]
MKAMKLVDLRFPCEPDSECAEMVENGIESYLVYKIGSHVTEIRVLKQHKWLITTDILDGLQLSRKAVETLLFLEGVENYELSELVAQLVSNGTTIKKQKFLNFTDESLKDLVAEVDKLDCSMISAIKQDSSTIERLDISRYDEWLGINVLVKLFDLFPSLKLVSFKFFEEDNVISNTIYTSQLTELFERVDVKVKFELCAQPFLWDSSRITELKGHFSRLQISSEMKVSAELSDWDEMDIFSCYKDLEAALRQHSDTSDIERHLKSLYRVKNITDCFNGIEDTMRYIALSGSFTEKLRLVVGLNDVTDDEKTKDIINVVVNMCPNLKEVQITFYNECTVQIKRLIKKLGSSLEGIKLDYKGNKTLSVDLVSLILKRCPKLRSLKSNGMRSEDTDKIQTFFKRFRRMRHLDLVKIERIYYPRSRFVYCNGRMSFQVDSY